MHTADRLDMWERREGPLLRVVPPALLVVSMAISLLVRNSTTPPLALVLGVAAFTGAWVGVFATAHPRWVERTRLMVVYFAGFYLLTAALVLMAPWFGFFAFSGYLESWRVLRGRWRFVGACGVACLGATSQIGGWKELSWSFGSIATLVVVALINMTVAGGAIWFNWVDDQRAEHRKGALAELTEANRRLAETLRENAALHAQLVRQAREAGVIEERQRMAREIHDTLAQGLAGIITQLEAASQAVPGGAAADGAEAAERPHRPPMWQRHVDAAARLARESLTEARRSVAAMRPQALEAARLPEALADVAARWSELHGVRAEVTTTGEARPMLPEIEVGLLRTAQEALANVAKHASATRVGITLSYMDDLVTLDVRDDGVGFAAADSTARAVVDQPRPTRTMALATGSGGRWDGCADRDAERADVTYETVDAPQAGRVAVPTEAAGGPGAEEPALGGFGLAGMRQRIRALAGTLAVESEPGAGTAISAAVPAVQAGGGA